MRGNMAERSPGVWRLRVSLADDPVTGRKRQASRTFRGTKRQAETELSRFVSDTARGENGGTSGMTVAGMLDAYCDHCDNVGRSEITVTEYRRQARTLRDGIGRTQLAKLQPHHLDELYAALRDRGVPGGRGAMSATSIRRYHALLSAALRQAIKWGWIEKNPAERATVPAEPRTKITAPTPAELHRLIECAVATRRPENALVIAIAAMTGARRGELCALRWSDFELDEGTVTISRAIKQIKGAAARLTEGDTKTHQARTVSIPKAAVMMLRRYRQQIDALSEKIEIPLARDPFVFSPVPDHGRPYRPESMAQMFYRVARCAGLSYHLHQLRHFAATQGFAAGFDPVAIAARLGHADASVTMRVYGHAIEERERALGDALGDIVSPGGLPE